MNNSQIDQNKPEVSIPDLIAETREFMSGSNESDCYDFPKGGYVAPDVDLLLNKWLDALESVTAPTESEREATCDGGCDYNSGPEEDCSLHGRPVAEVWKIVSQLSEELRRAKESVTVPADERREHYEIVVPGCDCGGCFGSIVSTDEGSVTAPTENRQALFDAADRLEMALDPDKRDGWTRLQDAGEPSEIDDLRTVIRAVRSSVVSS